MAIMVAAPDVAEALTAAWWAFRKAAGSDTTGRAGHGGRHDRGSSLTKPVTLERVIDERPQADRLLSARLHGTAKRHAQWRDLTEAEEATAVAKLRELAAGQADLLAETAGLIEGFSEGELDEPLARQAAMLCRRAGADLEAILGWIEEGRRRRANAGRMPFSGGLRGGGVRRRGGPAGGTPLPGDVRLFIVEEPEGRDLLVQGTPMARREIIGAEQQRLDRYKQRRDEYIRELVGLAPPLSEEQTAELVVRYARQAPGTHAAVAPPHRGRGSVR